MKGRPVICYTRFLLPAILCVICLSCSKHEESPRPVFAEESGVEGISANADVAAEAAAEISAEEIVQPEEPEIPLTSFTLKSAPANLRVFLDDEILKPVSTSGELRAYEIEHSGILSFRADGYTTVSHYSGRLPVKNETAGIKLENENGMARLIGEYRTGVQPKSAYFSPDGRRVFIPLLGQHGVDVFRLADNKLAFERRLSVPGSRATGFVEALCDNERNELWVSNMEENMVHIYDLETLQYKISLDTDGVFPKVIVQSPDKSVTVVSNWTSQNLSVFDSGTKELLCKIPVPGTPRGMAFSPDGSLLYTAIFDEPLIAVVSMTHNRVERRFRFTEGEGAARHVIYHDDKLYVSDMMKGTVNIIDAATGKLQRSRRIGPNINTIAMSPDGRYLFASSRGRNHSEDYTKPGPDFGAVYILNAADLSTVERIWGRNQPTGLAVSPDGKLLVFTDFLDANLELYSLP